MKKKLIILFAIVVVVGVGVKLFSPSLNDIIKKVVNKYGSEVTGTNVDIDAVDFSLMDGNVSIKGFDIANPEGYAQPSLFELGEVSATVDIKSVTKDVIIVKEIKILAPKVTYELDGITSNVSVIKENIANYLASKKADAKEEVKEEKTDDNKQEKTVIIEKVLIKDGEVNLAASLIGDNKMLLPLPAITLKDIGKEKGGASIGEALSKVFDGLLSGATSVVKEAGAGLNMVKDGVGEVAGEVGSAVKDVTGAIGGLFD